MFKVCALLVLVAAAVASAQEATIQEAAPEPYSYAYQTDSHAAQEQRDPSGKVTGFYTLVDVDGRERRVEYIADEAGFRAKVATNEVGTRSESPADVELIASEPTPAQFAPVAYQQAPVQQVQYVGQKVVQQPRVVAVQQPVRTQVAYVQQPQTAYYNTRYNNGAYYGIAGYGNGYGNGAYYSYAPGYAYSNGYGNLLNVGNYNNHLPAQYYRSVGLSSASVVPSSYTTVNGVNSAVRYVSQPAVTTSGVRTIGYPAGVAYGGATYTVPAGTVTSSRTIGGSSNLAGSSNYLVIQKRDAAAAAADKKSS